MASRSDFNLRRLEFEDLSLLLSWRNSDWVRANMYTDDIISWEEHLKWFSRIDNSPDVTYLICEQNNTPIGLIYFTNIDVRNNKAFWGFYLGEESGPPGRGAVLEFLALEYAFNGINLHKLCCEVFSFNQSVVKLHKRFGFVEEGFYKAHIRKNSKYKDVIALAIFDHTWSVVKDKMEKICFRLR